MDVNGLLDGMGVCGCEENKWHQFTIHRLYGVATMAANAEDMVRDLRDNYDVNDLITSYLSIMVRTAEQLLLDIETNSLDA